MPRTALLGVSTGILIVLSTLVAVALLNLPKSADAGPAPYCAASDASAEQGYGVTRVVPRRECERSDHSSGRAADK